MSLGDRAEFIRDTFLAKVGFVLGLEMLIEMLEGKRSENAGLIELIKEMFYELGEEFDRACPSTFVQDIRSYSKLQKTDCEMIARGLTRRGDDQSTAKLLRRLVTDLKTDNDFLNP